MLRLGSGGLTWQNGDRWLLSHETRGNRDVAGVSCALPVDPTGLPKFDVTASPQGRRWRFAEAPAVLLRESSQMVEAKTCSDRGDEGSVGASQELFACRSQAEPSPVFEWGNGHERPKVLLKRSFGYAAMGDEVRHCNFAAHTLPHELHSLLHVTRNRPTLRSPFRTQIVRSCHRRSRSHVWG